MSKVRVLPALVLSRLWPPGPERGPQRECWGTAYLSFPGSLTWKSLRPFTNNQFSTGLCQQETLQMQNVYATFVDKNPDTFENTESEQKEPG